MRLGPDHHFLAVKLVSTIRRSGSQEWSTVQSLSQTLNDAFWGLTARHRKMATDATRM